MIGQGELFDARDYESERPEAYGEYPAITRDEFLAISDQLHEEGDFDGAVQLWEQVPDLEQAQLEDTGFNNFVRMIGRAILDGEITAYEGYTAVMHYPMEV